MVFYYCLYLYPLLTVVNHPLKNLASVTQKYTHVLHFSRLSYTQLPHSNTHEAKEETFTRKKNSASVVWVFFFKSKFWQILDRISISQVEESEIRPPRTECGSCVLVWYTVHRRGWGVNLVGSYAVLDTLLLWYNSIWLLF